MCGVVGYFSNANKKHSHLRLSIDKAIETIRHRGPDGKGLWVNDRETVGLGHARLSIVDLQNGAQPFFSEDTTISVVANAEFYEFNKIRQDLISKGYRFKTNSDCEILIPLYQEYGLSMFDHLIGEFAFILHDAKNNRMIAARDRFGIKPLFYHRNSNETLFGSEIKSILSFGVSANWDYDTVHFDDSFVPNSAKTYFKSVNAIKPGHYVLLQGEYFYEKPYWDFCYEQSKTYQSENECIEELQNLLDTSVKTRLHGDVPIGCYVSGGIDSSTILSLAKKFYNKPVTSFTVKFTDQNYDESHLSKQVAEFNNVDYVEVEVDDLKIADNYKKAIWHNESLIYNAQGVAKFLLSETVKKYGYKVVLTGEGADEIFAGYPFFREDMGQNLSELKSKNKLVSGAFLSDGDYEHIFDSTKKSIGHVPGMWKVGAKFHNRFHDLYTIKAKDLFSNRAPYNEILQTVDSYRIRKFDTLNKSLYLWSKTMLPQVILSFLGDRMEMANSIEGRLPFLDHRLVEFAQKLPMDLKIKNTVEKYILRQAAKNNIPDFIYNRQKFPFTAPPIIRCKNEKRSPLHEMLLDYMNSHYSISVPFYDTHKIEAFLEKTRSQSLQERAGADPIVNRLLSAAVLSEAYAIK